MIIELKAFSPSEGRIAYEMIKGDKERREIAALFDVHRFDSTEIEAPLAKHGIIVLERAWKFPGTAADYVTCQDWAFRMAGLPKYTGKENINLADKLINQDNEDIRNVSAPQKGDIVAYIMKSMDPAKGFWPTHWGLVQEVGNGITIHSKWAAGNLYSHPIQMVSATYGNQVMFFRARDS